MTEYELERYCETHCPYKDPQCMKCPIFAKHMQEERNR